MVKQVFFCCVIIYLLCLEMCFKKLPHTVGDYEIIEDAVGGVFVSDDDSESSGDEEGADGMYSLLCSLFFVSLTVFIFQKDI